MKILLAEDDHLSRRVLAVSLADWGYEVVTADDGASALLELRKNNAPRLAILDWIMPKLEGPEVCRQFRALEKTEPTYFVLLSGRTAKVDIVAGLESGADDYLIKPVDLDELHARLRVGMRVVELQSRLADRVRELQEALARVQQLQGLLPICCYCKKIRDDKNYWQQVEGYLSAHSELRFSHGICPECYEKEVKPELEKLKEQSGS